MFKTVINGITLAGLILVLVACLVSCGNRTNNNVDSIERQIDEQAASHKRWTIENNGTITLCSENYYVTERGENVYGVLNFAETKVTSVTPEGKFCGLCLFVIGADQNQPKTTLRFDSRSTSFIASFNGGDFSTWPYLAQPNTEAIVGYYGEWEKRIRESEKCEIRFETENGTMDFKFNTKGFPW